MPKSAVTLHKMAAERQRRYRLRHPDRYKRTQRESAHRRRMKNLYNLTTEEYQEMHQKQHGKCVLPSCGQLIQAIDHNHATGKTRGLTCKKHNWGFGLFQDNPQLLREAADYLEKSRCLNQQ
jgi:hypothetical protein